MKVKIGPYKSWIGPYQIANLLQYLGVSEDTCFKIGERLADTWLMNVCEWIEKHRTRKVKVHIDPYDTWNMDETLAYIISPMLKQLKETTHGSPQVDDEDVPDHLKSTNAPAKENDYDVDDLYHARWEWILDEMIWAFEQVLTDWEEQYYSGKGDFKWAPIEYDENGKPKYYEIKKGPNHTLVIDKEGQKKHLERMENGFRLFGKYYLGLWD